MKKLLWAFVALLCLSNFCFAQEILSVQDLAKEKIIPNSCIEKKKIEKAKAIIISLQKENFEHIQKGYGPFIAVIYDENGKEIAKMSNTVVKDQISLKHAEINTIEMAHKNLKTYDIAPYKLSIYVSAVPCMMCAGGSMWSGIKNIYYVVSSKDVESIIGFDEGYKPNWIKEFKKRGINVYGNIESEAGKEVLKQYVKLNKTVYKPSRK